MNTQPLEIVLHAEKLFRHGIYCHAEMWNQVAHGLKTRDALTTLESLPQDMQAELRARNHERPWSLQTEHEDEVRRKIEAWCLQGRV